MHAWIAGGNCGNDYRPVFELESRPSNAELVEVAEKFLDHGVWEQHLLNWIKGMEEVLKNYGEGSYDFKGEKARAKQSDGLLKSMVNKGIFCVVFRLVNHLVSLISISVLYFVSSFTSEVKWYSC